MPESKEIKKEKLSEEDLITEAEAQAMVACFTLGIQHFSADRNSIDLIRNAERKLNKLLQVHNKIV